MTKQKTWVIASLLAVAAAFAAGYYFYKKNTAQAQVATAQDQSSMLMRAGAPVFGAPEAKVTIVEFFDPACEACRVFYAPVKQIINSSFGRVNLVLRYAPLHKDSDKAAMMLEAARIQGKYWPAVEATLASQDRWASHGQPDLSLLWPALEAVGVDIERAKTEMNTEAVRAILQQDVAALTALKVQRTPTFYVNGKPLIDFGAAQLKQLVADQSKIAYGS